jgi:hypothetical protein
MHLSVEQADDAIQAFLVSKVLEKRQGLNHEQPPNA